MYYSVWGWLDGLPDGEVGIKTSYSPTGAFIGAELGIKLGLSKAKLNPSLD